MFLLKIREFTIVGDRRVHFRYFGSIHYILPFLYILLPLNYCQLASQYDFINCMAVFVSTSVMNTIYNNQLFQSTVKKPVGKPTVLRRSQRTTKLIVIPV